MSKLRNLLLSGAMATTLTACGGGGGGSGVGADSSKFLNLLIATYYL